MVRRVQQLYGQSPAATPAGDPVQAAGKSSKSQPALSVKPPHGSDVSSVTALHSVPPSNIIPRTRVWIRGITNFDLRIRCCEERPRLIFPNSATLRCEHVSLYISDHTHQQSGFKGSHAVCAGGHSEYCDSGGFFVESQRPGPPSPLGRVAVVYTRPLFLFEFKEPAQENTVVRFYTPQRDWTSSHYLTKTTDSLAFGD